MARTHASLLGTALLCSVALPLRAQAPGYQQLDTRQIYAEYHAEVLSEINELQAEWGAAWANDDVDELLELYWDNAVVITREGTPLTGHSELRGWLEGQLPDQGTAEAFMLDFDASGGMAVIYGNYSIEVRTEAGPWRRMTGPVVTVYSMRSRRWRIRSQVFVEN